MKSLMASIAVAFLLSGNSLIAGENLHGDLLELHSCQLYIGGCVASSESPQDGRYLLRVWNFTNGSYDGATLRSLQVALLETSEENLASRETNPNAAMAYLPQSASPAQTSALISWLKSTNPELARLKLSTRTVSMQLTSAHGSVSFTAGDALQMEVRPFQSCGLVSCGESLWYTPRSSTTSYTVGVTSKSIVNEPKLALRWIDHGKNNVFEGHFGEGTTAHPVFQPPALVCAVADHLAHE
jgi:Protein of unknown function (DUF1326)